MRGGALDDRASLLNTLPEAGRNACRKRVAWKGGERYAIAGRGSAGKFIVLRGFMRTMRLFVCADGGRACLEDGHAGISYGGDIGCVKRRRFFMRSAGMGFASNAKPRGMRRVFFAFARREKNGGLPLKGNAGKPCGKAPTCRYSLRNALILPSALRGTGADCSPAHGKKIAVHRHDIPTAEGENFAAGKGWIQRC